MRAGSTSRCCARSARRRSPGRTSTCAGRRRSWRRRRGCWWSSGIRRPRSARSASGTREEPHDGRGPAHRRQPPGRRPGAAVRRRRLGRAAALRELPGAPADRRASALRERGLRPALPGLRRPGSGDRHPGRRLCRHPAGDMAAEAGGLGERTAWARNVAAPLRDFLNTQAAGAVALLAAAIAALLWANSAWWPSYEDFWTTTLAIRVGHSELAESLREWVNSGLMTFFFLVVGLEAKRELDVGALRERKRAAIPFTAALGGLTLPVLVYLALNAGGPGAHGWGAAMSTDTAFALGVLGLVAPGGTRLRVAMLTIAVF